MPFEILTPPEFLKVQLDIIERAGRTSHNSQMAETPEEQAVFFRRLLQAGHWSVFEHSLLSVRFYGVTRGFTHEVVRHRHTAITQQSTRYVTPKGMHIRIPDDALKDSFVDRAQTTIMAIYKAAKPFGKDVARQFLPIGMMTEIVVSANFREWHTIFARRTARNAHWEIREEMTDLLVEVQKLLPPIFDDFIIFDDGAELRGEYKVS